MRRHRYAPSPEPAPTLGARNDPEAAPAAAPGAAPVLRAMARPPRPPPKPGPDSAAADPAPQRCAVEVRVPLVAAECAAEGLTDSEALARPLGVPGGEAGGGGRGSEEAAQCPPKAPCDEPPGEAGQMHGSAAAGGGPDASAGSAGDDSEDVGGAREARSECGSMDSLDRCCAGGGGWAGVAHTCANPSIFVPFVRKAERRAVPMVATEQPPPLIHNSCSERTGVGGVGFRLGEISADPNHLQERLLDQAQARASCTPPFWGSFA